MNKRPSSPSTTSALRPNSTIAPPAASDTVLLEEAPTVQVGTFSQRIPAPHEVEIEVQRRLQNHPALKFSRLHVHQCREGICLEGFLESNEYEIDLCEVVRGVEGVTGVLNRVVLTRPGSTVPKKG